MNFEKERLLIIAPHADDEILGCFGLIDFIKKNHGKVYVQVLTLGGYAKIGGGQVTKEKWKSEFLDACNFLKIDGYDIGYFDDQIRHLDTIEQSELIDLIEFQSKVSLSKINLLLWLFQLYFLLIKIIFKLTKLLCLHLENTQTKLRFYLELFCLMSHQNIIFGLHILSLEDLLQIIIKKFFN